VVQSLVQTTLRAVKHLSRDTIVVAGGVAANQRLRHEFARATKKTVLFPPNQLNTDNGAMIALAAWLRASRGEAGDGLGLGVLPTWALQI
jgi:N6-L-threonylcarbamoyladenine synthase